MIWVEVNGMDACWGVESVGKNVITGGGDGQDDIVRAEFQEVVVDPGIFPRKGVDVVVLELLVLL